MKLDKGLKIALIILLIILLALISFGGIYIQDKKSMTNILKDFKLGMDLNGGRIITIEVDDSTETVYYDKDGNKVEKEDKEGKKEEVPVNSKESLTKENFIETKKIIEKRLNNLEVSEYLIRQDEETGRLTIQIPEDDKTDLAIQYLYSVGKFTIVDEEENVLLDNSNIKEVKVAYNTTSSGTTVFLNIEFNKDSVEKLREISKNYTHNHEEGEEHSEDEENKQVTMKVDGTDLISTSFDEEITDGIISLSVGTATTNSSTLNSYIKEASNLAILLNNGVFPISYKVEQNRYVLSDITQKDIIIAGLVVAAIIILSCIVLAIKYKKLGLLAGIAHIGYVALLLILIRYTNVILTIEGMIGFLISIVLNYIFNIYLLKTITEAEEIDVKRSYNKTVLAMLLILVPALVVGITLCFVNWMPIFSFGEIIFWGILVIFIYNTVLTRTLLICSTKNQ